MVYGPQMILTFDNMIPENALAEIREAFARISFHDGRASAGAQAKLVKANLEAVPGDPVAEPGVELEPPGPEGNTPGLAPDDEILGDG